MNEIVQIKIPELKTFIERFEQIQAEIAKKRDELRDLACEIEDFADSCDQGIDDLDCAIDKFSEYV
jgi:hypothetical protein